MSELKPCPFCGHAKIATRLYGKDGRTLFYMECDRCQSSTGYYADEAGAVEGWNHRIDDQPLTTSAEAIGWQLAKLQGMVAELIKERDELKRRVKE